jgi:glycosyltransferase involved in cell wall biosynthesis
MTKTVAIISEPKAVSFWNISKQIGKVLRTNDVEVKLYPWGSHNIKEKNVLFMGNVFGLTINHMLRFIPDKNIIFYGVTEGIPILNEMHLKVAENFTLITPSQHSKRCLENAGLKVDSIIPHGIDTSIKPDEKFYERIKTLLPQPTNVKPSNVMLCIAGNVQRKALDKLLVAYKIIQAIVKDSFLILHSGTGDTNVTAMEHALDLKRFLFTNSWGMLDPPKIAALYKLCDFYVQPSMVEGFGLTYLEAFRWEKPVIGINCPSVNEIVKDHYTGILAPVTRTEDIVWQQHHAIRLHHFDIDDLVQAMLVLTDNNTRIQMGNAAKKEALKWDINDIYPKFVQYLK